MDVVWQIEKIGVLEKMWRIVQHRKRGRLKSDSDSLK
jgi:hypothetical protein